MNARRSLILCLTVAITGLTVERVSAANPQGQCVVSSVATLPAQQRVTLIALSAGQTLIASDHQLDLLSSTGERRPFELSIKQIATAAGVPEPAVSIAAVAAVSPDDLLLYTTGTSGQTSAAALWLYRRRANALSLVAGPDALGKESGMGHVVDLADAQLAVAADDVWLLLRTVDASVLFRLDRRQLTDTGSARLARPFTQVVTSDDQPFRIRADDRIFARAAVTDPSGGTLQLLRTSTGESWQINSAGQARYNDDANGQLSSAPPPTALPLLDLPPERFGGRKLSIRFFPEAVAASSSPLTATPDPDADTGPRYPTLCIADGNKQIVIDRDAIHGRAGFPIHALRFTSWCVDPASGDVIAYDAMSGEVMRLRLSGL